MTTSSDQTFTQISANNSSVDETIESLVNLACARDEVEHRSDRKQLERTTRLLFLSSLILGERNQEDE
jgi:hypothetical protein